MPPKKIILILVIAVVGMFAIWTLSSKDAGFRDKRSYLPQGDESPQVTVFGSLTDAQGEVTVEATPKNIGEGTKSWEFEVVMDTHSVELNNDMVAASELVVNGSVYKPVLWEGDPAGGHHRAGTIRFSSIAPLPKSITLVIREVGGVSGRKFQWPLE